MAPPPCPSREAHPARRFQLSHCLVFGFWVKIAKLGGKEHKGVSQEPCVGRRPPFLRISQARSGTRMQISRRLLASKPECDAHVCLNLAFTSQDFRLTQPDMCATSGRRPSEWTKGTPCLVSRGSAFVRILNGNHKTPMKAETLRSLNCMTSINRYTVPIGVLYAKKMMSKKRFIRDLSCCDSPTD
jgi:hypothetical protein